MDYLHVVNYNVMVKGYCPETVLLMQTHFKSLGERERRHYAAIEAQKLGHGGGAYISRTLGIDRNTIILGKAELYALACGEDSALPPGRQRRKGGGRKKKSASHS